jgi:hypothetical protein
MNKNKTLQLGGIIFGLISIFHFARMLYSWEMTIKNFGIPNYYVIEEFIIPQYFSYIAFVLAGFLAWQMIKIGTYKLNK